MENIDSFAEIETLHNKLQIWYDGFWTRVRQRVHRLLQQQLLASVYTTTIESNPLLSVSSGGNFQKPLIGRVEELLRGKTVDPALSHDIVLNFALEKINQLMLRVKVLEADVVSLKAKTFCE